MSKPRRHAIGFSLVALAALATYLWMASGALSPVQAEDLKTMGAASEAVMPVLGIHELFDEEKRNARIEEFPAQF